MAMPTPRERPRRPKTRPLGYVPSPSSSQLEKEKTIFREGLRDISDLVQYGGAFRRCATARDPRRMNDANIARFFNKISDKVVNTPFIDTDGMFRQVSSVCDRTTDTGDASMSDLQCEVLGPFFCSDCCRTRRQDTNVDTQRVLYPRIEVHQRTLVAPEAVLQFNTRLSKTDFQNKRVLACGCVVNDNEELHRPVIYTQHDVYDRVRHARKAGSSVVSRKTTSRKKTPSALQLDLQQEPEQYEPEPIRVSVHFNSPTDAGKELFFV